MQYKDGRVGIYDTKDVGFQEEDNKTKAEILQKYIKEENSKGKNLCGGIIIIDNNCVRINNKTEYQTFKSHPEDWNFF